MFPEIAMDQFGPDIPNQGDFAMKDNLCAFGRGFILEEAPRYSPERKFAVAGQFSGFLFWLSAGAYAVGLGLKAAGF